MWRGALKPLLADRQTVAMMEHHAALPWSEINAFMASLAGQERAAARAAVPDPDRDPDKRGAELDLERDQSGRAGWRGLDHPAGAHERRGLHRAPLSDAALEMLRTVAPLRAHDGPDAPVFPDQNPSRPMSNMAMLMLLRRMGRGDLTPHGFRSTFRDWVAEATSHQREIAEASRPGRRGGQDLMTPR